MSERITYHSCPACDSANIARVLQCRDYTVSREIFEIWNCDGCSLRFTQNVPGKSCIGDYYKSDNYISHSNTANGFINKLYKLARRYTLGRKRQMIQQQTGLFSGNLLDVGCGIGSFVYQMKEVGWNAVGLEPDEGARARAKQLYGITPQTSDQLFNLAPGFFDVITMWHVLEHVHDLHGYMKQFKKILSPKGKLIIAVPNYTSFDAAHYHEYWAAYDVPRHLYHFSPTAMKKLAEKYGFDVSGIKPMLFDPFYIAMLSEKYKNGKGNLLKAVWHGGISALKTFGNKERCSSLIYVLSLSKGA